MPRPGSSLLCAVFCAFLILLPIAYGATISGTITPVGTSTGALVTLSGTSSATVTVSSTGTYSFSGLPSGNYTVTPSQSGQTFTPPSQSVTVSRRQSAVANFSIVQQQSSGTGSLIVDAQTWGDSSSASATISTPAFTTSAGNELLLAFVATDGPSNGSIQVNSMSGAGLTWSLVKRTNSQPGTSEIWRAFSATPLTNVVVSATLSSPAASSITLLSFKGVDTTGTNGSGAIGATASANASSGAPSTSLVTTRNNSWVLGVGNDYDNALSRVVGANQSMIHQYLASVGDTYWVQGQNAPTPLSGSTVVINDTSPTGDHYNLTAVEVLPSTSGGGSGGGTSTYTLSGTISPSSSGAGSTVTLTGAASMAVTADSSGNYSFTGLPNGSYTITPSKSGFTFSPSSLNATVNGANLSGRNFSATVIPPQTYSISGTVSPLASGPGTLLTLSGASSATATADSSGNYAFSGIGTGSYTVTPSKSGYTFTPPSSSLSISSSNVTGVNFTAATQSSGTGSLILDAQTWGDSSSASATISTPAFTTSAGNELLLAFIAADGPSGGSIQVNSMSGAGLTWSLVKRTNSQLGTSEVWRAFSATPLTNVVVSATLSSPAASSITLLSFKGVDTTGTNGSGAIGATASANASSGAPSTSLVTTRNNSWVLGVGNDYDNALSRVVGANQSMIHQYLASVGDTYWVQGQNAPTPLSGSTVVINDTSPTGDHYNLTAVEVLPSTSGGGSGGGTSTYTLSGTISPSSSGAGSTVTLTGAASMAVTADSSGNYSFTGLPNGSYTITPNKSGFTFSPATLNATVNGANLSGQNFTATVIPPQTYSISGNISTAGSAGSSSPQCGLTLNWTDPSCQIIASGSLGSAWSVISRHGEYLQSEAECNVPSAVNVTNSILNITATATSTSCVDFNPTTGQPTTNSTGPWPYKTGDVEWNTFNFLYGTIVFRMKMPNKNTQLWPAIWMMGTNCQNPNKYTGDPGTGGCPVLGNSGYEEIDIVECDANQSPGWCNLGTYNPGKTNGFNFDLDTNWHVFDFVWTSSQLSLFEDGTQVGSTINEHYVNPMFLIFQIQAGGIGSPTNLPATASLDYVKVCNTSYTRAQCEAAASNDPNVIFYDDFNKAGNAPTPVSATVSLSGAASATTTTDSSGNYSFNGLGNGSYVLTPSSSSYTFSPSSLTVNVNTTSVTGANFSATPNP